VVAALQRLQARVGALGGGDVSVRAGGDIANLSVVIPTNGRLPGAANTVPQASALTVQGGGDLEVRAHGDINSALFYVGGVRAASSPADRSARHAPVRMAGRCIRCSRSATAASR